jgi:acetate kinase
MKILVLNAGSSTQKSCLYELTGNTLPEEPPKPLWEGEIDWTRQQGMALLKVKTAQGIVQEESFPSQSRVADTRRMLETLWQGSTQLLTHPKEIDVVGHRVVHGGSEYKNSTIITPEIKTAIARLAVFAPIHNPVNLEGIEIAEKILEGVPQVAVFDTAFHSRLQAPAYVYPGPYSWLEEGIRRYGFHGISHQYCTHRAAQILKRDVKQLLMISCHLGNGCSLAAIREGWSVDTTMGFTPLEGLMMGTRCGSIDPGILIHLLRQHNYTPEQLDAILNRNSGLLGISQVSGDLRLVLEAVARGDEQAQLALDVYIHRLRSHIGAMLANLGGLDVLIFTAGVGENSPLVRASACGGFAFFGLKIDPEKNVQSAPDRDIATADSKVRVLVIHTQEDWEIARECWQLKYSRKNWVNN